MPSVNVVTPGGRTISVDASQVKKLEAQGYRPQTLEESHDAGLEIQREEQYGGAGGAIRAGLEGAARGLTLGVSDAALEVLGADAEGIEERRARNPGAAIGGEILGAAAPALLSGGAGAGLAVRAAKVTPAGMSARAARAVSRRMGGKIAGQAAEGAVDAALFGAGQTLSQAALSDDPLTTEQVAANIGLGSLLGAGIGGGLGAVGALGQRISRSKAGKANPLLDPHHVETKALSKRMGDQLKHADLEAEAVLVEARQRRGAEIFTEQQAQAKARASGLLPNEVEVVPGAARTPRNPDLTIPDEQMATTAGKRAVGEEASTVPGKKQVDADATKAGPKAKVKARVSEQPTLDRDIHGDNIPDFQRATAQAAAEFEELHQALKASRSNLKRALGGDLELDLAKLVKRPPAHAIKVAQKFDEYAKAVDAIASKSGQDLGPLSKDLFAALGPPGPEMTAALERAVSLKDPAAIADALGVDVAKLPEKLGGGAQGLLQVYAMGRLTAREAAKESADKAASAASNFIGNRMSGVASWAAARAVGHVVGGPGYVVARLLTQVGDFAGKLREGAGTVLTQAGKPAARKAVQQSASSVLGAIRFGDIESKQKRPVRQRMDELSDTMANPARLEARLDDALAPVRAQNLQLGWNLAEHAKKRLAYYHETMPKQPVMPSPLQRSRWDVAPSAEYDWSIRIKVGENPLAAWDMLKERKLTVGAVETLEALWPEVYSQMQQQLVEGIGEARELPYADRLQLSIFFRVPVDDSMDPAVFQGLQAMYMEQDAEQTAVKAGGSAKPPQGTKGQALEAR